MGTPRRVRRLSVPALVVCLFSSGWASAQPSRSTITPEAVTQLASAGAGSIAGLVLDEKGAPLADVVVSALGQSTAFAVTDRSGRYSLHSLAPGPYLVRAHLPGYLVGRSSMVSVRPASRTVSSFTLRRDSNDAKVARAGVGVSEITAAPGETSTRDESETAWRLRHLKRPILKDATAAVASLADEDDWFLIDSFELLGRAVGSSASFFAHLPLQGQVNLLTTGAFDNPTQLLQLNRIRGVTYFAVGAPVGGHGDWFVKAALNQGDLSSWVLSGAYHTRRPARHRYHFGMSYALHRYEGGNAFAMAAVSEADRNVGEVFAHDEWTINRFLSIGYGGSYAHYDYLMVPSYLSPRVSATVTPWPEVRLRASAGRQVTAPGAEEFLPPARAHVLPPQRTFAPLTRDGLVAQDARHYEIALEREMNRATIGIRTFEQRVDNQLITVFGMRGVESPAAELGHFFVAAGGDVALRGWGVSFTHALSPYVRGTVDYAIADAHWTRAGRAHDRAKLARSVPAALREEDEFFHDLTTTVETTLPQTATRVYVLVKMNNAFIRDNANDPRPGVDDRFVFEVTQGLPFMNFRRAEWEMLVGVRNMFRDAAPESSLYDELLVARPPKRLVGGLTVKF